jgi:hypothetical protein
MNVSQAAAVLFACNLNKVRSPMAAGLMRRLHGDRVFVDSCGLRRADADLADPFVAAVMDELGVDVTGHFPKSFDDLEDESFDVVISLTPEAHRVLADAGSHPGHGGPPERPGELPRRSRRPRRPHPRPLPPRPHLRRVGKRSAAVPAAGRRDACRPSKSQGPVGA